MFSDDGDKLYVKLELGGHLDTRQRWPASTLAGRIIVHRWNIIPQPQPSQI